MNRRPRARLTRRRAAGRTLLCRGLPTSCCSRCLPLGSCPAACPATRLLLTLVQANTGGSRSQSAAPHQYVVGTRTARMWWRFDVISHGCHVLTTGWQGRQRKAGWLQRRRSRPAGQCGRGIWRRRRQGACIDPLPQLPLQRFSGPTLDDLQHDMCHNPSVVMLVVCVLRQHCLALCVSASQPGGHTLFASFPQRIPGGCCCVQSSTRRDCNQSLPASPCL